MRNIQQRFLWGASIALFLAALVSLICDYLVSGRLSWSLIVLLSVSFLFIIIFILVKANQNIVFNLLFAVSGMIFPFLWLLSKILKNNQVFSLGSIISILSITAIWCIYLIAKRHRGRLFYNISVAFLISIPLSLGITHIVALFNEAMYTDFFSDLFHACLSLLIAAIGFIIDHIVNKSAER